MSVFDCRKGKGVYKIGKKKKFIACKMEMALINTKMYQKHMVYLA